MLNPPMFNDSAPSNNEDGEKTWIQVYSSISGKEFSIDYVGSTTMGNCIGYEAYWRNLFRGR